MNADQNDYLAYAKHLEGEHREIWAAVEQLRSTYFTEDSPTAEKSTIERKKQVQKELHRLRDRLRSHFDEEEAGGCIEEAISRAPQLGRAAMELESEHRQLLNHLDRVINDVEQCSFASGTTADIERSFKDFAEVLHDHETRENRLLEQGFNVGSENGA